MAYRTGRLSVARDQFEVLGVRGDINKSTTFGTEDKCNPLEATIGAALRYKTLRSLTATEIGAGTVNVAKMVRGSAAAAAGPGGGGAAAAVAVAVAVAG